MESYPLKHEKVISVYFPPFQNLSNKLVELKSVLKN